MKSNQECVHFVRERLAKGEEITKIAELLLDSCLADDPKITFGLGGDNTTVVIVKLNEGQ